MAVSASFATSSHRSDSRGQVHRSNLHDPSHRAKCKRQWPGFKAHFFAARQLKPKLDSQTRSRRLLFLAEPQRSACRYGGIHRDYRGCAAENFWILDSSFLLRLAKYCLTDTNAVHMCQARSAADKSCCRLLALRRIRSISPAASLQLPAQQSPTH